MPLLKNIKQDLVVNKHTKIGKFIVVHFRLANYLSMHRSRIVRLLGKPFIVYYRTLIHWFMSVDIPEQTKIGEGLSIWHAMGIVINPESVLGKNVTLRQTTTIGIRNEKGSPIIGDNVDIGAHVCILGNIIIGNNVTIGAGSLVLTDLPDNCVAVGFPAKVIKIKS